MFWNSEHVFTIQYVCSMFWNSETVFTIQYVCSMFETLKLYLPFNMYVLCSDSLVS
jgi:hypothetical protein